MPAVVSPEFASRYRAEIDRRAGDGMAPEAVEAMSTESALSQAPNAAEPERKLSDFIKAHAESSGYTFPVDTDWSKIDADGQKAAEQFIASLPPEIVPAPQEPDTLASAGGEPRFGPRWLPEWGIVEGEEKVLPGDQWWRDDDPKKDGEWRTVHQNPQNHSAADLGIVRRRLNQ